MTKATAHQAGKSQQWAKQVLSVSENARRNSIGIHFDTEPSPLLQSKLRAMNFRSSRAKSVWYGDRTEEATHFAERLREALPGSADGPELLLAPSVATLRTNLEKKAFSFVIFTLKNGQTRNYVLFEPFRSKAEVIASNFAHHEFGEDLLAMAILPKTHIKEARTLFDEGRIIYPEGVDAKEPFVKNAPTGVADHKTVPGTMTAPGEKIPLKMIYLTTHHQGSLGIYDQGITVRSWAEADKHVRDALIGKYSDVYYKIIWQDGNSFEGSVDLEPPSFYDRDKAPLSNHLKRYLTNVKALEKPHPLAPAYLIDFAKEALEHYHFDDLPAPVKPKTTTTDTPQHNRPEQNQAESVSPVVFDPGVMARLISSQNYLGNAWALSHPKDILQQESFSAEELTDLRAFFAIYIEEDQPMQEKYMQLYEELHNQTKGADPEKPDDPGRDPLANGFGVYTRESAGNHFETLEIPIPKTAGYHATVYLVKTTSGHYRQGITCGKHFGDHSSQSNFPDVRTESYPTRKSALKAALLHHEQKLEIHLGTKDTILNNEAIKHKRLALAMKALKQYAKENGISLEAKPDSPEPRRNIIQGLETAYWEESDEETPVNKVYVNGQAFHQARLRGQIADQLRKLPLSRLEQISGELAHRFRERRPLSGYAQSLMSAGRTGDARKASQIVAYADDMMIDHDLGGMDQAPVMSFLVELLFSGSPRLSDVPHTRSNTKTTRLSMKKQNQYELNKEIEAFIDQKDGKGDYYDEEEKNHIRRYTGSGGLMAEGATGSGTLYEYYTPESLVKKMWDIAYHYGYDGGAVLEPAVGTGRFLKYAPPGAAISGFETNHYAARIAQILYPKARISEKAFETHFFAGNIHLKDKFENPGYSLVIGNPPYGAFTGRYAGLGEKRYTGVTEYDQYFTLRSLDLLKPGGLLVFLVPSYFMLSTQKYNKTKEKINAKAEWVDAYRLPEGIFPGTEVGTDILVLRKRK